MFFSAGRNRLCYSVSRTWNLPNLLMTTMNSLSWSSLFLVVVLQEDSDLIQPGTLHCPTWMAGIICGIKIYLLRNQFQLIAKELAGLKCFTAFTGILYIKGWFAAPSAIAAPAGDLVLLKGLLSRFWDCQGHQQSLGIHLCPRPRIVLAFLIESGTSVKN